MVAWCCGGGKCVQIYIDAGEVVAANYRGVIVIMNEMDIE